MHNQHLGSASDEGDLGLTSVHVRRAIKGSEDSLTWIITQLSPLLKAQAQMRLGNNSVQLCDAEDLVSAVWRVALKGLRHFDPLGRRYTPALVAYLGQILLNEYRTRLRRQILEQGRRQELFTQSGQVVAATEQQAEQENIVSAAIHSEESELIESAIQRLPQQDREIVIMRGVEMIPNHEVATRLGLRPNTVAAKYGRALDKLRSMLPESIFFELAE